MHEQRIQELERTADKDFAALALPHPDRTTSIWYFSMVFEDYQRIQAFCTKIELSADIDIAIDKAKYAFRHGLSRINSECRVIGRALLPERVRPHLYARARQLFRAALVYERYVKICHSVYAGEAFIESRSGTAHISSPEEKIDRRYSALEYLLDGHIEIPTHLAILGHWARGLLPQPEVLDIIKARIRLKNRLITYEYDEILATGLSQQFHQQDHLLPADWRFPWGGHYETTVLVNSLSIRCCYHIASVHFGAVERGLVGGGEADICLFISREELIRDIALLAAVVDEDAIATFVDFLTHGVGTTSPDPALQPLIPDGRGNLFVTCLNWLSSRRERNLLSLHTRVASDDFNRQSKLFEISMTEKLAEFAGSRWRLRTNVSILGEEVDAIFLDASSQTILILELRWVLQPGDAREILQKKRECAKKAAQLRRKFNRLSGDLAQAIDRAFGISIEAQDWTLRGAIVIEGFSGTISPDSDLPIVPLQIFKVGASILASLKDFAGWLCALNWLPAEGIDFSRDDGELPLDDGRITYPAIQLLKTPHEYFRGLPTSPDIDSAEQAGSRSEPRGPAVPEHN